MSESLTPATRQVVAGIGERNPAHRPRVTFRQHELRIPASDHKYGSASISLRIRGNDARRMKTILDTKADLPFENLSDVQRAALHIGISLLENCRIQDGLFALSSMMANRMSVITDYKRFEAEIAGNLADLEDLHSKGEDQLVRSVVRSMYEEIKRFSEDFQVMARDMLDKKVGHYIREAIPASQPSKMTREEVPYDKSEFLFDPEDGKEQ